MPLRSPTLGPLAVLLLSFSLTTSPCARATQHSTPEILAPGAISTAVTRHGPAGWSEAEVAPFSGVHRDVDPFVAPDGSLLLFSSDRPIAPGDTIADFNTWVLQRAGEGWGPPEAWGLPIDGPTADVFVSLDRDGTLYFSSDRDGVNRIYLSTWTGVGGWAEPEVVLFEPNTTEGASNPAIHPDGAMLVFAAPGPYGEADLHVTCRSADGWTPARALPEPINSAWADFAPAFRHGGRHFYFTSERPGVVPAVPEGTRPPGDIYHVSLDALRSTCPSVHSEH